MSDQQPFSTLTEPLNGATVLGWVAGVFLPLLTAYVTKEHWNKDIKTLVLLFLSSVTAVVTQLLHSDFDHEHFDWKTVVFATLTTFLVGVMSHFRWDNGHMHNLAVRSGLSDELMNQFKETKPESPYR